MSDYKSVFGVIRQSGLGEGRDVKYGVSAKPALGAHKVLEVVVDANGPAANAGAEYGRDGAYLPKGAVVVSAVLLTEVKGSGAGITISLVKKNGTSASELLGATTPAGDGASDKAAGAAIDSRLKEDRYFKAGGTRTGYKGKLVVEYI